MNKQELIKNIRKLSVYGRDLIEIDEVSNLVNQLDEPGKVKVSEEEGKKQNSLKRLILIVKVMLRKLYIIFQELAGVII